MNITNYYKFDLFFFLQKGTQIGIGGQCGGLGYNGSTTCVSNLTCYMVNLGLFQCSTSCQQYWQCKGNGEIRFKNKILQKYFIIKVLKELK